MGKTAVIIGATGLVGSNLLTEILENEVYSTVSVFSRRITGITHSKLKEHLVSFDSIEEFKHHIKGDVLFSCMGTTIKTAGSKDKQYKVDFTYQFEVAKAAKQNGIPTLVLVSSTGANSKSFVFYSKMKGQLEEAITKLSFHRFIMVRPSILVGERPEPRFGEEFSNKLLKMVTPLLTSLEKYRGIKGIEVAKSMIQLEKVAPKGQTIVELDELFKYIS